MMQAVRSMFSEESRALWAWLAVMFMTAFLIPAGGLGLAAAGGLYALFAMPGPTLWRHLRRPGLVTLLALAALVWASVSHVWSPYRNPDEALKLALLTPLFIIVPVAAARIAPERQVLAQGAFIACIIFILVIMAMESLTGGDLTLSYKLDVEGYDPARTDLQIRVDRVLSRGATPAIMLTGIAVMLLWTRKVLSMRILAVLAALVTVIMALDYGVQANAAALAAAIVMTALAARWPAFTLKFILTALAVLILAGPLLFTLLLGLAGPELGAAMPMSWEWRLEIWRFALERIWEAPLAGHGIGASRVLDGSTELRGYEIDLLPLHAHNASLTIWLETGFAGAALIAGALFALARSIRVSPAFPALTVMMIVFALSVWLVNVAFSYGIWQEWHHGALALAIAAAIISRPKH